MLAAQKCQARSSRPHQVEDKIQSSPAPYNVIRNTRWLNMLVHSITSCCICTAMMIISSMIHQNWGVWRNLPKDNAIDATNQKIPLQMQLQSLHQNVVLPDPFACLITLLSTLLYNIMRKEFRRGPWKEYSWSQKCIPDSFCKTL